MIKTGDKLLCTNGNACYVAGEVYTVGSFVNEKYFELMTGSSEEYWYATIDNDGIRVRFNSTEDQYSDACFSKVDSSEVNSKQCA